MPLIVTDEAHRKEVEHAKKELRARRKDSADKWVELGVIANALTGVEELWLYNVETGTYAKKTRNRYKDALLKQNNDEMVANLNRRTRDLQKVASIPMDEFFDHFGQAYLERDQKYVTEKLNDPDFAKFRTWKGRL